MATREQEQPIGALELRERMSLRGSELRDQAVDTAERARQAVSRTPKGQWAKLAGAGLALVALRVIMRRVGVMSAFSKNKMAYQSLSLGSGIVAGTLAGAAFSWLWRVVSAEDEAPEPTALDRNIREVLIAGALQGAVFGLVKAVIGRITAKSYRQFTGHDFQR